jgi:hypothetical protein
MRVAAVLVALVLLATLGAGTGRTAAADDGVFKCPRLSDTVNLAFGVWDQRRTQFALVGSRGVNREGGYVILGAGTETGATTDRLCRRSAPPRNASQARLSKPYVYKKAQDNVYFQASDGERILGDLLHVRSVTVVARRGALGVEYHCVVGSGVTVRVRELRGGAELRVFDGRQALATAVVRRQGQSSFRVSDRCEED